MVNVLYAESSPRPDFNEMINTTVALLDKYNVRFDNSCRIFVDGANPSFIRALKDRVDGDENYEQQIQYYKKHYPSVMICSFYNRICL